VSLGGNGSFVPKSNATYRGPHLWPGCVRSVYTARYKDFLKRLRKARLAAGLTQAQVAVAMGKPQSFISKCETGERRLDVVEVQEFAKLYKRPLSYFLPRRSAG